MTDTFSFGINFSEPLSLGTGVLAQLGSAMPFGEGVFAERKKRRSRSHCFHVKGYMVGPYRVKRHRVRGHRRCR